MVKQLRYAHSAVIFKRITILSLWIFRLLTPQNLKTAIAFPWLLPLFSQNTGKKRSQQYEQSQSSLLWIESCHKRKGYLFFSHRSVCLSWSDLSCFQYQHQWDRCMSACRRASRRLPWGNWQHQRFREKSIRRSLTFPSEIPIPVWRRDACQSNGWIFCQGSGKEPGNLPGRQTAASKPGHPAGIYPVHKQNGIPEMFAPW